MSLLRISVFFLALVVSSAYADVTFTVPDGSHVVVNGVPVDGGGTTPPPDGGGTTPPPDGGGTTPDPNAACLENLHAEKRVDHGSIWTMGGPLGTSAMKDGVMVGGGGSQYVCFNARIYMRGDDTTYYVWNGSAWVNNVPDPTHGKTWPLIGVSGTSPNGTKAFELTDSYGHKWKFCNGTKVCRDGVMTGGDGSEMLFWNNGVYILGGDGSWYIWTGASFWPWGSDPSAQQPPPTFGTVQPPPSGGSSPPSGGGGSTNNLPVPNPPAIMPGSNGHIIHVTSTVAAALASAQPGDTVEVPAGVYAETVIFHSSVWLKGTGTINKNTSPAGVYVNKQWYKAAKTSGTNTVFDCSNITALAHSKACILMMGDSKVSNVEVFGAGMRETASGGTAGIRPDSNGWIYIDTVYTHDNQNGVFTGGYTTAMDLKNVIFEHNGLGDGLSHNFYFTAGKVIMDNVTSRNPNNGHAAKIRGQDVVVNNSNFDGGPNGTAFDAPDGGHLVFTNTVFTKPAGAPSHNIFFYAEESQKYGTPGFNVTGGSVNALCDAPKIVTTGPMTFTNTTKTGNAISVTGGGTVTGLQ